MAKFDPSSANVDEVLSKLEKADGEERERILAAERNGKKRSTILEAYGIDPDQRVDATGRVLYPWEVAPEDEVRRVEVEESEEARKAREAQRERDEAVAAAAQANTPGGGQGGVTPPGTGVTGAPAAGTATAGATTGGAVGTTTTTAGGAPTV